VKAVRREQRASSCPGVASDRRIAPNPRTAHCTIEENHQLLAQHVRIIRTAVRANPDEPVAERAFVPARNRSGEDDGLASLADRIREGTTAKLFRAEPYLEGSKDPEHAARRIGRVSLHPLEQSAARTVSIAEVDPDETVAVIDPPRALVCITG
jgi:hypothetical protein